MHASQSIHTIEESAIPQSRLCFVKQCVALLRPMKLEFDAPESAIRLWELAEPCGNGSNSSL